MRARTKRPTAVEFTIDMRRRPPYDAGAFLLTLLAFPDQIADQRRFIELHLALCAAALTERARSDAQWSNQYQSIKPIHFALPPKQVAAALRTFNRRMRDRMIAGSIANAIIFNAAGLNPKLPKGCYGFSIKQLMKMALDDTDQLDAENAEQRIWRDGLPVVHLAAAVQAYLNRKDKAAYQVSYGDILFNEEKVIQDIAHRAKASFELMKGHPDWFKLGRKEPILLRVI